MGENPSMNVDDQFMEGFQFALIVLGSMGHNPGLAARRNEKSRYPSIPAHGRGIHVVLFD
jgi:hypothetical protein